MTNNLLTPMFLPFKLFCYEISVSRGEFVRVAVPSWSPPLFLALGQVLGVDQEYFSWRRKVEHEEGGGVY